MRTTRLATLSVVLLSFGSLRAGADQSAGPEERVVYWIRARNHIDLKLLERDVEGLVPILQGNSKETTPSNAYAHLFGSWYLQGPDMVARSDDAYVSVPRTQQKRLEQITKGVFSRVRQVSSIPLDVGYKVDGKWKHTAVSVPVAEFELGRRFRSKPSIGDRRGKIVPRKVLSLAGSWGKELSNSDFLQKASLHMASDFDRAGHVRQRYTLRQHVVGPWRAVRRLFERRK